MQPVVVVVVLVRLVVEGHSYLGVHMTVQRVEGHSYLGVHMMVQRVELVVEVRSYRKVHKMVQQVVLVVVEVHNYRKVRKLELELELEPELAQGQLVVVNLGLRLVVEVQEELVVEESVDYNHKVMIKTSKRSIQDLHNRSKAWE